MTILSRKKVVRIKRLCALVSALVLAASLGTGCRAADISAKAAVLYDPAEDAVLYEKNADEKRLIASVTKIMTALVVLENCALNEEVTITPEAAGVEGSSMYLRVDGHYEVLELMYGMMLESGNDAAAALAIHVAGSVEDFAALMNEKAEELGLEHSHFVNPHGLNHKEHYSTARDLALLTAAALEREDFLLIVSSATATVNGRTYRNHNKLLTGCEGIIGVKTGYTIAAGRTLVTACERDGRRLICVTLSDPNDWNDHTALYEEGFRTIGQEAPDRVRSLASWNGAWKRDYRKS